MPNASCVPLQARGSHSSVGPAGSEPTIKARPTRVGDKPDLNITAQLEKLRQTLQADFDAAQPIL
jgi:hypothetical protein